MIDTHLVFIVSIIVTINVMMCYCYGIVSQRVLAFIGGPAFCTAVAAAVAASLAPPPPPLTPAEQAKRDAHNDGFAVGLATGMMMPR